MPARIDTAELAKREIWNYREAARVLNLSENTIKTLRECGEIDGFELTTQSGRIYRYVKASSARAWVDRKCATSAVSARVSSKESMRLFRIEARRRHAQAHQDAREKEKPPDV